MLIPDVVDAAGDGCFRGEVSGVLKLPPGDRSSYAGFAVNAGIERAVVAAAAAAAGGEARGDGIGSEMI